MTTETNASPMTKLRGIFVYSNFDEKVQACVAQKLNALLTFAYRDRGTLNLPVHKKGLQHHHRPEKVLLLFPRPSLPAFCRPCPYNILSDQQVRP